MLITADEEIGSPTGRPLVEEVAAGARAVLVLEPPVKDGTITTSRSGLARYQVHIRGRAAHAGNGSRAGVSAIEELAHQITAVHRLSDPTARRPHQRRPGRGRHRRQRRRRGGLGADRRARLDARTSSARWSGRSRACAATSRARCSRSGAESPGRRWCSRRPAAELARSAIAIAAESGIDLGENASPGGSDGNFAAAVGTPVIDGLGPTGTGAHAIDERVSLESIRERTALLAALLARL